MLHSIFQSWKSACPWQCYPWSYLGMKEQLSRSCFTGSSERLQKQVTDQQDHLMVEDKPSLLMFTPEEAIAFARASTVSGLRRTVIWFVSSDLLNFQLFGGMGTPITCILHNMNMYSTIYDMFMMIIVIEVYSLGWTQHVRLTEYEGFRCIWHISTAYLKMAILCKIEHDLQGS